MKTFFLTALLSFTLAGCAEAQNNVAADADGSKYVPYEQRTGNESVVYFTRKLSAEGLIQAYEQVCDNIKGHVGVKLHTGEPNGPNIIPREWVKALMEKDLKGANIIETNTRRARHHYPARYRRQMVPQDVGWQQPYKLRCHGGTDPFQGSYTGRLRRFKQEHRHRMCRRTHRKGMDPHHSGTRQPVGQARGRVHGAHDGSSWSA